MPWRSRKHKRKLLWIVFSIYLCSLPLRVLHSVKIENSDGRSLSVFPALAKKKNEMPIEFKYYLSQCLSKLKENSMEFWSKQYVSLHPMLNAIARKYLLLVTTSVPLERLFSRAGNILTNNRSRLSLEHLQHLLILNWLSLED